VNQKLISLQTKCKSGRVVALKQQISFR